MEINSRASTATQIILVSKSIIKECRPKIGETVVFYRYLFKMRWPPGISGQNKRDGKNYRSLLPSRKLNDILFMVNFKHAQNPGYHKRLIGKALIRVEWRLKKNILIKALGINRTNERDEYKCSDQREKRGYFSRRSLC